MACTFCRGMWADIARSARPVVKNDWLTRPRPVPGRKLKCDGRPICANCNRRGLACAYVPVYVAPRCCRRPHRAPTRANLLPSRIQVRAEAVKRRNKLPEVKARRIARCGRARRGRAQPHPSNAPRGDDLGRIAKHAQFRPPPNHTIFVPPAPARPVLDSRSSPLSPTLSLRPAS